MCYYLAVSCFLSRSQVGGGERKGQPLPLNQADTAHCHSLSKPRLSTDNTFTQYFLLPLYLCIMLKSRFVNPLYTIIEVKSLLSAKQTYILRAASNFPTAYDMSSFADLCFTTYLVQVCSVMLRKAELCSVQKCWISRYLDIQCLAAVFCSSALCSLQEDKY